jgi:hypothetical protein
VGSAYSAVRLYADLSNGATNFHHRPVTPALVFRFYRLLAMNFPEGPLDREQKRQVDAVIANLMESGVTAKQLQGCRFLQIMARRCSLMNEESGFTDPLPNLSSFSTDRRGEAETWGPEYLKSMLYILKEPPNLAVATALLNLLTLLIRTRPTLLPILVPALIDLWEKPPEVSDPKSFTHSVKLQLTNITAVPDAERYYPLVMDALSASGVNLGGSRKRTKVGPLSTDEDADTLATAASLELEERSSLRSLLDITRVPLDLVAELVIGSMQYIEEDELLRNISRWRPLVTTTMPEPAIRADPRRDPRKRGAQASSAGATGGMAIELTADDLTNLSLENFSRLLKMGLMLDRLSILAVKLATILPDGYNLMFQLLRKEFSPQNETIKTFLGSFLRAVWIDSISREDGEEGYRLVFKFVLELAAELNPAWLSYFVDVAPQLFYQDILHIYEEYLVPRGEYASGMEMFTSALNSRRGKNFSEFNPMILLAAQNNDSVVRKTAIEAVCRIYPNFGKDEYERLAKQRDSTWSKELFYGLVRVNLDLLLEIDPKAITLPEERELLGRAVARSAQLLPFLTRCFDSANLISPENLLELIKNFVPRSLELSQLIFDRVMEGRLDGCFSLVIFTKETAAANKENQFFTRVWPKFLAALVNSSLASIVHSQPTQEEEDFREKLVYRWCGKFVELQLISVGDIFIQVHSRTDEFGGIKTCDAIVKSLLTQPAWKASSMLMAGLLKLAELQPLPLLFYKTLLVLAGMKLSGVNLLSALSKSLKSKPWETPVLWEGVIRCIKSLLPESSVIALQLPMAQLIKVIEGVPGIRLPLKDYLNQQPPSYRNRFKEIFPLLLNK